MRITAARPWGQMIRKQNAEIKDHKKTHPAEANDEVIKLKKSIKDKEKKSKETEADMKKLVEKLAGLEDQIKKFDNSKHKDANNQLNDKKKELKKVKEELEKANKRAGDIQDIVNQKNSRICELETTNTRRKRIQRNRAHQN